MSAEYQLCTLYVDTMFCGIDVNKVTVPDLSGRPQFLVENGLQPMKELVG